MSRSHHYNIRPSLDHTCIVEGRNLEVNKLTSLWLYLILPYLV